MLSFIKNLLEFLGCQTQVEDGDRVLEKRSRTFTFGIDCDKVCEGKVGRKRAVNIGEAFARGGLVMIPLLILSFLSLSVIIERIWFWWRILTREREIAGRVLEASRREWQAAAEIARRSTDQPIGRFLNAALDLHEPEPEVLKLALESAADEELAAMQRGDKILEATIAIAPLLGLLGTVLGLINSLGSIRLGDIGTSATGEVTFGIAEALYSTATGLIVALISLVFFRVFQGLVSGQAKLFQKSGNELELLYRQRWAQRHEVNGSHSSLDAAAASVTTKPAAEATNDPSLTPESTP